MKTWVVVAVSCAAAAFLGVFLAREHQFTQGLKKIDELKETHREQQVAGEMRQAQLRSLEKQNAELMAERNALKRDIAELKGKIRAAGGDTGAETGGSFEPPAVPDEAGEAVTGAVAVADTPASEPVGEPGEEAAKPAQAGSFGQMLKGMLKDPKTKGMMRSQQEMQITMMYGDLVTELGLSEEDGAALTKLLVDRQMAVMELSIPLMDATADEAERDEASAKVKAETGRYEDLIKAFLGAERAAKYDAYHKTLSERITLGQFKRQTQNLDTALSDHQFTQMMEAMKEEREAFTFTRDVGQNRDFDPSVFEKAVLDTYFKEKEQLDGRIVTRASGILTPEQLDAFKTFQANQRAMQKMSMEMARNMFVQKKDPKGE